MTEKVPNPKDILHELLQDDTMRPQPAQSSGLDPVMVLLRQWQTRRLTHTYADLLEDDRHRLGCQFFLTDIYAPRDFSQRDQDIEQIHSWLSRLLPAAAIQLLTDAIELNRMTYDLDHRLLAVLVNRLCVTDSITVEQYAEGYRLCDNYSERKQQIDQIVQVAKEVGELARFRLLGPALKVARAPVERAGWGAVYDFLSRGYIAFNKMKGARYFAQTIREREMQALDRIFACHPDPFDWGEEKE